MSEPGMMTICRRHMDDHPPDPCPWCEAEQLQKALGALKERVHRIDMLVETWESPDMVALINSVRLLARLPTSAPVSREADTDE